MTHNQACYEVDWQLADDADNFDDPQEAIENDRTFQFGWQLKVGSRRWPMAKRATPEVAGHRRPALVPSSAHGVDVCP